MVSLHVYGFIMWVWFHYMCMISLHVYGFITCVWFHYMCMVSLHVYGFITCELTAKIIKIKEKSNWCCCI